MSYTYSATILQIPMTSFFSPRLGNLLLVVFLWAAPRLSADGDWSSWLGSRMDSVWSSEERDLDLNGRPWVLRWSAAIGSGYAGPALSGTHVVVMDWQPDRVEDIPKDVFERERYPEKNRSTVWTWSRERFDGAMPIEKSIRSVIRQDHARHP